MLAYIDTKQGRIHIIRSDGQSDTTLSQSLFATNVTPASQSNTATGASILNSLAWSPDGSTLAFIASPTGIAHLYIYTLATGHIEMLPTQLQSEVFTLSWTAEANTPTLTWSVGTVGHIHAIMLQPLNASASQAKTLVVGDYAQATYSPTGVWLLLSQQHIIFTIRLDSNLYQWTNNGGASLAQWSPEGSSISYFQNLSNNTGSYHIINLTTGSDTSVATGVFAHPAPAWSSDEHVLLYWNGTHLIITHDAASTRISLSGTPSFLSWYPATHNSALIATQNGLYMLDTIHGTMKQISKTNVLSAILWTEIP